MMAPRLIEWESRDRADATRRPAEAIASRVEIGATGVTLSGRADRIDVKRENLADILDYKTGSSPSKVQAHTLVAPQLALEGALLMRGAFHDLGSLEPADLAYVRLKATGDVAEESILTVNRTPRLALSDDGRAERDSAERRSGQQSEEMRGECAHGFPPVLSSGPGGGGWGRGPTRAGVRAR